MGLFSRRIKDPVRGGTAQPDDRSSRAMPTGRADTEQADATSVADSVADSVTGAVMDSAMTSGTNSVVTSTSVTVNGRPATPEEIAQYEALTGLDLDGDGVVGDGRTARNAGATRPFAAMIRKAASQARSTEPADRVSALERLVALRDSGALTPAEFESEKQRLLGS